MAKHEAPKAHAMVGGGSQVGMSREQRKPKKKHVRSITIRKGKNGGHVISHQYESGMDMPYEPDSDHVFGSGDGDKALAHIKRHAGIKAGDGVNSAPNSEPKEAKAEPAAEPDADDE